MDCPVCRNPVKIGLGIRQECGHYTHGHCMDQQNPNFKQCAACRGDVDLSVPLLPDVEPGSSNGRDYISHPLPMNALQKVRKKVSQYLTRGTRDDSDDVHFLLSLGPKSCPIDWMIREKQIGLQSCLEEGVTIDDFLANGYSWADLKCFTDLNSNPERIRAALSALHVNAEHLRDELPFKEIKVAADIQPTHMIRLFGLHFPNSGGMLITANGQNQFAWDAKDLVAMGFTQKDLVDAGIQYLEQYEELLPDDQDEVAMKITDDFVYGLPSIQEPLPTITEVLPQSRPSRRRPMEEPQISQPQIKFIAPEEPIQPRRRRLHGLKKDKK